jgi:hypothetical protein
MSTIVNRLLRHVDAMQGNSKGRTPIVLIRGAKFNTSMPGNRSSSPSMIANFRISHKHELPKPFHPKDKAQKTDNEEEQEIGVGEDGDVSGGSGDAVEAVQAGSSSGKHKKRKVAASKVDCSNKKGGLNG